jgi:integrase
VRRLIASIGDLKPADLRAKAMFLLFSVYGFRSVEVRGLILEDIDWRRGLITVRRAKRGKTQQFPLQSEVGEAIALYLENARPKCPARNVFVTLTPPYRPVLGHTMSAMFAHRTKKIGMAAEKLGPHMLRRACATQLLRSGSSLKDIADFLGHSDLRSVSNYAKFDPASLRNVANFSLRGFL